MAKCPVCRYGGHARVEYIEMLRPLQRRIVNQRAELRRLQAYQNWYNQYGLKLIREGAPAPVTAGETRAPHYVDKECSYCFGEGAVSMSNGERRMCTLCNGTGKVRAEPEPAPRNMFGGAPMKVVEWPAIPSKPSSDK